MAPIFTARISTMIAAFAPHFLRSLPPAVYSTCPHCGSNYSVRVVDGTCEFTATNNSPLPSLSRFKLVSAVTGDGNCSISCACEPSERIASGRDSGVDDPTSSMLANLPSYKPISPDFKRPDCSRCHGVPSMFSHTLCASVNVRPKYPYLCAPCAREIIATGEVV